MNNNWWKPVIVGALAGVLNGMFGAGGGLVLVPLLISWVGIEQKKAFATSVAVMLPISLASYVLLCIRGVNVWEQALPYLLGGVAGGLLSAKIFKNVSAQWLHRAFSLFILYGGIKAVLLI